MKIIDRTNKWLDQQVKSKALRRIGIPIKKYYKHALVAGFGVGLINNDFETTGGFLTALSTYAAIDKAINGEY